MLLTQKDRQVTRISVQLHSSLLLYVLRYYAGLTKDPQAEICFQVVAANIQLLYK